MARELKQSMDVPFGLITSAWGGSAIEAWISDAGLRAHGGFDQQLDLVELFAADPDQALTQYTDAWQDWWRTSSDVGAAPWQPAYDAGQWPLAPAQLGNWQQWPGDGMADFTGMIWYRNSFELQPGDPLTGAVLELGGIDDTDVTWVNGQPVGTMFGWGTPRRYGLPDGSLQAGLNSVTVSVYNSWGSGGLYGPPEDIRLVLADGRHVSLSEGWRFSKVPSETGAPPLAPWESITGLTTLYNAMIAPLKGFGLGGAMWYQGESNTGRADQYQGLLQHLAADLRSTFRGDLPFIVVQLPNFGHLPAEPVDSGWARLRDAQQKMAAGDPLTGLVVTLDSADRTDLHPPNKRIVGERAAAVARALRQGSGELADGIVPLAARRHGDRIMVEFASAGGPLRTAGANSPGGFELCDSKGSCAYTSATITVDGVALDARDHPQATEVRYAWADAPLVNLFGATDLPVGSFRIEIAR
jgi:sialate O-acetylesterase